MKRLWILGGFTVKGQSSYDKKKRQRKDDKTRRAI